jgi:hypothetical protein
MIPGGPLEQYMAKWKHGPASAELHFTCPACGLELPNELWSQHYEFSHPRYIRPWWVRLAHWLVR